MALLKRSVSATCGHSAAGGARSAEGSVGERSTRGRLVTKLALGLVVLKSGVTRGEAEICADLVKMVRERIGPVNLICIRRSFAFGPVNGFVSGLGAALGDGLFAAIMGFGLTWIGQLDEASGDLTSWGERLNGNFMLVDKFNAGTGGVAATLTIDPGVTMYGNDSADILIVNRGSQILVNGTLPERRPHQNASVLEQQVAPRRTDVGLAQERGGRRDLGRRRDLRRRRDLGRRRGRARRTGREREDQPPASPREDATSPAARSGHAPRSIPRPACAGRSRGTSSGELEGVGPAHSHTFASSSTSNLHSTDAARASLSFWL